jgi:hypothetical protein
MMRNMMVSHPFAKVLFLSWLSRILNCWFCWVLFFLIWFFSGKWIFKWKDEVNLGVFYNCHNSKMKRNKGFNFYTWF